MARHKPAAADAIGKYLTDLVGRNVDAKPEKPVAKLPDGSVVAAYATSSGVVEGLCVCDVGAGASLAAALSLVGPDQVKQAVGAKKLEGVLRENVYEVCNVMARLVSSGTAATVSDPLVLRDMHDVANAPDEVKALLASPAVRTDAKVKVQGYGEGYLALLTT